MNYKNEQRIIEIIRKMYGKFGYWYPVIEQKGYVIFITGKKGTDNMSPAKFLNFIHFLFNLLSSWHQFNHSHNNWKQK